MRFFGRGSDAVLSFFCVSSPQQAQRLTTYVDTASASSHGDRQVKDWSYVKTGHYVNYIKPHLQRVAQRVTRTEDELPHHSRELDPEDKKVLLSEPVDSMRQVRPLTACACLGTCSRARAAKTKDYSGLFSRSTVFTA